MSTRLYSDDEQHNLCDARNAALQNMINIQSEILFQRSILFIFKKSLQYCTMRII